jgi:hypothetical protein
MRLPTWVCTLAMLVDENAIAYFNKASGLAFKHRLVLEALSRNGHLSGSKPARIGGEDRPTML